MATCYVNMHERRCVNLCVCGCGNAFDGSVHKCIVDVHARMHACTHAGTLARMHACMDYTSCIQRILTL